MTGLARAGKTAFLTSVAANLLALGAGRPVLPELRQRLGARAFTARLAPSGTADLPRFDHARHLAALAADPPTWPERTSSASLLAFDLTVGRDAFGLPLPPQSVRLELLDYPGEWLLDLPLLRTPFEAWSEAALRRMEAAGASGSARAFLQFSGGLPSGAPADDALAATGHRLYRDALHQLRDEAGLAMLQPGRFLMPAPGAAPPWMAFFPHRGGGGLHRLLADRYGAYVDAVERDLAAPMFGNLDRVVVLVDLLSALHAGPEAFFDASDALAAAAGALRWQRSWLDVAWALGRGRMPPRTVSRVAFAATKSDHVAERQRGNLQALLRGTALAGGPAGDVDTQYFAIAAVRCTTDVVHTLEGRPVSAVRGRRIGDERAVLSYPGEVPDRLRRDDPFWSHPFLDLPQFEPQRPPEGGRGGVPELGLGALLAFLLEDVL